MKDLLRKIPKVDDILKDEAWAALARAGYPEGLAKEMLRDRLDDLRAAIMAGTESSIPPTEDLISGVRAGLGRAISPALKRVINATGIIIHTNLGRALLAPGAAEALANAASHYVNLEYDLEGKARGDRYAHCASLLKRLTGCEDALVVNNNAGAVFLVLNTLAEGKEVVISRGELVEIGGSFRIPDVMKKSGAILREVGATNRTYKSDFELALHEGTGLMMKAHTSNYKIKGFVREIGTEEMAALGKAHAIPTYFDAGSGLLLSLKELGIRGEPVIADELAKGLDIISFSGDKLAGGPQAGIILGRTEYIEAMKKNPLTRALRADKFTLAGLESTLVLYLDPKRAMEEIPALRMLHADKEALKRKAARMVKILKGRVKACAFSVLPLSSEMGGGTLPDVSIPSFGIAVRPSNMSVHQLEERLRGLETPIIARIEKDALLLDMRTILRDEEKALLAGIETALADG